MTLAGEKLAFMKSTNIGEESRVSYLVNLKTQAEKELEFTLKYIIILVLGCQ